MSTNSGDEDLFGGAASAETNATAKKKTNLPKPTGMDTPTSTTPSATTGGRPAGTRPNIDLVGGGRTSPIPSPQHTTNDVESDILGTLTSHHEKKFQRKLPEEYRKDQRTQHVLFTMANIISLDSVLHEGTLGKHASHAQRDRCRNLANATIKQYTLFATKAMLTTENVHATLLHLIHTEILAITAEKDKDNYAGTMAHLYEKLAEGTDQLEVVNTTIQALNLYAAAQLSASNPLLRAYEHHYVGPAQIADESTVDPESVILRYMVGRMTTLVKNHLGDQSSESYKALNATFSDLNTLVNTDPTTLTPKAQEIIDALIQKPAMFFNDLINTNESYHTAKDKPALTQLLDAMRNLVFTMTGVPVKAAVQATPTDTAETTYRNPNKKSGGCIMM